MSGGAACAAMAATMAGLPQRLVLRAHFAQCHYFSLTGSPSIYNLLCSYT